MLRTNYGHIPARTPEQKLIVGLGLHLNGKLKESSVANFTAYALEMQQQANESFDYMLSDSIADLFNLVQEKLNATDTLATNPQPLMSKKGTATVTFVQEDSLVRKLYEYLRDEVEKVNGTVIVNVPALAAMFKSNPGTITSYLSLYRSRELLNVNKIYGKRGTSRFTVSKGEKEID